MTSRSVDVPAPVIRETYEEFFLDDARVAMIEDPENGNAWIQSDVTEEIQC